MYSKFLLFFLLLGTVVFAQKKPLDHSVYDSWQSLGTKTISNNGLWIAYAINVQEGDNILYLKENSATARTLKINRGTNLIFSADSKFAAATIKPLFSEIRQAKLKKKNLDELVKDSLVIIDLTTLKTTKTPGLKNYSFPKNGASILAHTWTNKTDSTKATKESKSQKDDGFEEDEDDKPTKKTKEILNLSIKNLSAGTEKNFESIGGYLLSKNGKQVVFEVKELKKNKNIKPGVFLLATEKWALKTLVNVKGNYTNFVFDDDSELLAFVGENDSAKKEIKDYNIYYNSPGLDTAQILADNEIKGMPSKWAISKNGKLNFSKDGTQLFFGIAPIPSPKDTTLLESDHAKLDIWSYKDDYLQPMQLKNLNRDLKKSYLSVIDIYSSDPKIIPLTDVQVPEAMLVNEGNAAFSLASTDYGNRIEMQWTGKTSKDYYLVDNKTGNRKKIIENLDGFATASPNGQYILYFNRNDGNWFTYQISNGKTNNLTAHLPVKFVDEENDVPEPANSYGFAGWTEEDKLVLIYDRYDIWALSPEGKPATNLTIGYGRANKITFRVEKLDNDSRFFDKNEKLWLSAFNNTNKESGYYRKSVNDHKLPLMVYMGKAKYSGLTKAKNNETYLFEKSTYINPPNIYLTKDFSNIIALSNTNPQQAEYNWGTAELVNWTTYKGHPSQGILYKPEDFDPNKKYPMIVYFYEKLSDGLYSYQAPAPTPSRLNISYFVSNGYIVFAPDISYEIGHPGKSAEEYINSGVDYLTKNTWIDATKIGIQGQSWGGYQVAHLITTTNKYAAAWSGAPVVNMISAYGGIRWGSGMNRQFQYEKTQSRIGATLWEKPELYIENSPLFNIPKVNTPVVIMANDADGAVPWYQGIEMFTALRRLNKPVWMLNYNNEEHNLVQRQNRKDIQIREQQFFDYYLKGTKAPAWMVNGIPATEKGKTWGFELIDGKP